MHYMFNQLYQKAPLGVIALSLMFGTLIGIFYSYPWFAIIFLCLFSLGMILISSKNIDVYIFILMTFSTGWYLSSIKQVRLDQLQEYANSIHLQKIEYSGFIKGIKETEKGWRAKVLITHLETDSSKLNRDDVFLFVYGKKSTIISLADSITGQGTFKQFQGKRNPGDFDFRSFFMRKHIFGKVFSDKKIPPNIIHNNDKNLSVFLEDIRHSIKSIFNRYTDIETGGMLTALILGEKSYVDEGLRESFAKTGVIHVLAVSGLHVGYVLLVLSLLTSVFRIPWGWDRFIIIIGLIFFCLLTGMKPSVIRASLMAGLFMIAPVVNRSSNNWNIIGTSAIILLIYNPHSLLDLGFLLSFSAVISIIYFYKYFEMHLPNIVNPTKIDNKVIKFSLGLFLVSIAAQIGTLPITAFTFGQAPVISSIANVFIVPLIGLLVALGFALIGFAWMPLFPDWLGESAWALQWLIKKIAQNFASFPYATIQLSSIGLIEILLYTFIIATIILIIHSTHKRYAIWSFLISLNLLAWPYALEKMNITDIIYLDVGQGDGALILLPDGKSMLIDAGFRSRREDMGERVVIPVLNHFGIDKIDWLVMSHPHSDHIGGIESILQAVKVDTVLDTYIDYHSWTYNRLLTLFDEKNITRIKPSPGEIKSLNPGINAIFFSPDSVYANSQSNVNNASIVFNLTIGEKSFLFTGDLEEEGDHVLSRFGSYLKSDILKIAHHGSITSSTPQFLKEVQPKYAIVSVGEGNKFRHPSDIVMDRLRDLNIQIKRTDLLGAIWFKTNGKDMWEHKWK